jgi:hypothetical protein
MPHKGAAQVKVKVKNSLSVPRTVVLEPWTTEYLLPPGRTYEILAEGDLSYPLEIELFEEQIIVYAFDSEGAMLSVFQDGREVQPSD